METKKREQWLDNVKLVACIAVFWGHFYSAFYGQLSEPVSVTGLDKCISYTVLHIAHICFNGDWWVFIFCIISGMLAWKKKVESFRALLKALFRRYMRFVLPVLAANIFVVIYDKTVGFRSFVVGTELNNKWLATAYHAQPTVKGIIKSALLMNNEYIGALWVLIYIFIGSCLVYCVKYLSYKLNFNDRECLTAMLACWPILCYAVYSTAYSWFYVVATFSGMLLNLCMTTLSKDNKWNDIMSIAGILAIVISLNTWEFDQFWKLLSAFLFLWFCRNSMKIRCFLEARKTVNKISPISFSVYLLQGPILLSASMIIYQMLTKNGVSYPIAAIINWFISTIIVIVVSGIYYLLVQKRIDSLITKI